MKLPKTFRLEKNLEAKTEQLLEEAKVFLDEEEAVKLNKDLAMLVGYGVTGLINEQFHEDVEKTLLKDNYSSYKSYNKKLFKHWVKEKSNSDMVKVVTQYGNTFSSIYRNYCYAKIKKKNLKKFVKKLDKQYLHEFTRKRYLTTIGVTSVTSGGISIGLHYALGISLGLVTLNAFTFGAGLGALLYLLNHQYKQNPKRKKKIEDMAYEFYNDDLRKILTKALI